MNGMSNVFQNHLEVLLDRSIKNDFCVQDFKKTMLLIVSEIQKNKLYFSYL